MPRKSGSSRASEDVEDHGGDSFAPLRRCQTSCLKCLVISKYLSILFAMLPSIYLSCILMWLNTPTGLPATVKLAYDAANPAGTTYGDYEAWTFVIAKSMTQMIGCLTGFTIIFGLGASASIWFRWCSSLGICNWTVEVVGHFFLVFFIVALLSSATALQSIPGVDKWEYNMYMGIMVGILLPACCLWSFSASVVEQRRLKMVDELASGE